MKKLAFAALLLLPMTSSAQTVDLRYYPNITTANAKAELDFLEGNVPTLTERDEALRWSGEQVEKKVGEFNAEHTAFQTTVAQHRARIAGHRSRCSGITSDPNFYEACMNENNQIGLRSSELQTENRYFYDRGVALEGLQKNQVDQEAAHQAEVREHDDRWNELLGALRSRNDECSQATYAYFLSDEYYVDGTLERAKAVCGSMFDGN